MIFNQKNLKKYKEEENKKVKQRKIMYYNFVYGFLQGCIVLERENTGAAKQTEKEA